MPPAATRSSPRPSGQGTPGWSTPQFLILRKHRPTTDPAVVHPVRRTGAGEAGCPGLLHAVVVCTRPFTSDRRQWTSRMAAVLPFELALAPGWSGEGLGCGHRAAARAHRCTRGTTMSVFFSSRGVPGVERAGVLGRSTGWSNRAPPAWTVRACCPLVAFSDPARCAARGGLLRQENAAHAARTWRSLHRTPSAPAPVRGRGMAGRLNGGAGVA